jgi:acyl carrier protein
MKPSTIMDIRTEVLAVCTQVAREQGRRLATLTDRLHLLDSGLDSLCLAVIVARLEQSLGVDPFTTDENLLPPETFGEFVELYERAGK